MSAVIELPTADPDYGQPPQDEAAEQAVLGAMLQSRNAVTDVVARIGREDFYQPRHQYVYDAIMRLHQRGDDVDPVTVKAELERHKQLRRAGGAVYLVTLTQATPSSASATFYAKIVAEMALRRRLVEAGARIAQFGYAGEGADVAEVLDLAHAEINSITPPDGEKSVVNEGAIEGRLQILRINREATRRLDAEEHPPIVLPRAKNLTDLLAEPDAPTPYLIDRLVPEGGRVLLSAQYKAGKTILVENLVRSLVDGEPFLDRFTVCSPRRRVVLIDNELSENTLRRWLREQKIQNTDGVADVISLRGRIGQFNLLDDDCRQQWATRLRDLGCDYLILDCLRPVLDVLGLDENRDAGRFLVQFDALLDAAGVGDALIAHHMGHANERARGDSRLQDWPDAIWRIMRETENPDSARYFSAYGRDVDVAEGRLTYDNRRLTYGGGSRRDIKAEAAYVAVIAYLAEDAKTGGEGKSKNNIETEVDHPREAIRTALDKAVKREVIRAFKGDRGAHMRGIANPCDRCGLPLTGQEQGRHLNCPLAPEIPEGLFE